MAESSISVGSIGAQLRIDTSEWQRGLHAASQQLTQFQAALAQQVQQGASQAAQLGRAQQQAATQAAREQMQAARLAAQEHMQQARLASNERIAQARAAGQAEVLAFRQSTEAARQAFAQQRESARAAAAEARQAAPSGGGLLAGALQVAGGLGIVTSLSGAISSLKDFAAAVVAAGTRLEALRAQFTAFQGAQAAQATLEGLFRTAQRLGVEFTPLATAFRQFDAATRGTALEGAKAERVFTQIVTGMRAMGASSDQVGRALLALQQIVSKGIVSQEELRGQLSEALPGAMNIAARALGVTTQELGKMVEKGVEATSFVETFANQIAQEFGGKAATATNTLASAWQRLANEFDQLKAAIAASGLGDALKDIYTWMAKIMETWRQARAERDKQLGGQAPTVPPELQGLSPAITAREKEIARLRADAADRRDFGAMLGGVNVPGLSPQERSAANEARIRQLQEEQRADIARLQRQLLAEGAGPGATGPGPADAALDAITKAIEAGKARLRQMDVGEGLLPGLDLAKDKTTEWRKVLDEVFAQIQRIPEPLLKSILPSVQKLIDPANQLMLALTRDADLAKDAAGEVGEMRRRVAEGDREAAQELAEDRKRRQAERGDLDLFGVLLAPEQEADLKEQARQQRQRIQEFAKGLDLFDLDLPPELERQRRASDAFDLRLREQAEQLQLTRPERPEARLRREMERAGVPMTEARASQLQHLAALREQQERLNAAIGIWHDLSQSVGSAWTSALQSVAAGTATVAEAFRAMAQSILQSMADIAANQAFQAVFKLGVGLLTSALTPTAGVNPTQYTSPIGPGLIPGMAAGGTVTQPTLIMAGERGPEHIVPQAQMQALLSGTQGGQRPPINLSVIHVANQAQAEQEKANAQAKGHEAIIVNAVNSNLSLGESSSILRTLRTLQR